jgi:hypothetical protein
VQLTRPAGCVPLRPLGLADILDGAVRVVRRNPRVMLGLSVLFAVARGLVVTGLELAGVSSVANLELLGSVVGALLGAVLTGMLTLVVTQDVLGERLDLAAVWARVRGRTWALVGLSIVTGLLEYLGLFVLVGVWLWGIWAVAVPALMVERTTIRRALGRSYTLVNGMFWRVWGIRALGWLMLTVIGLVVIVPFDLIGLALDSSSLSNVFNGDGIPLALLIVQGVGAVLSTTVTAPVRAAIDALLYVDLRTRREALDITVQLAMR